MSVKLTNVRPLTLSDPNNLGEDFWDDIGLTDYENDEHVNSDDWIIGDVIFGEVVYTIIHGFPGDNASGIIYNSERKEYYPIGESIAEKDCQSAPQLWYLEATNDVTEFGSLILHRTQNEDDGCFPCGCSESILCDECKSSLCQINKKLL